MGVSLSVSFTDEAIGRRQALRAVFEPDHSSGRQAELWMSFDSAWTDLGDMQRLLIALAATFGSPSLMWRTRDRGNAPVYGGRRSVRAPDLFAGAGQA